jgi:hypothetical protein
MSPTFLAQLASTGAASPGWFVVLEFANETLYLFSGVGTITPAGPAYSPLSTFPYGQAFIGVGQLGRISAIPQTNKVAAQNIVLSLSGIPPGLVTEAVAQVRITGSATVFLAFFGPSGAVIADPIQVFAGSLDVPTLDDSGETSTISITAENPLLLLNEAPNRQFDDMDQQIYFPGDLGLSFVDTLGNLALFWPSPLQNDAVFAVDMILAPDGADIPVGGTVTLSITINYSDGSHYSYPGGTGSGQAFIGGISSMNPSIATVALSGVVTGVKPGICLIEARSVFPNPNLGGTQPSNEKRVACKIIVHS